MNTDKTLAEVQPGERVRLATVPYDRARDLIGDAYNAGTHGIGYGQQAMELHAAIIPAQPSQPSGLDLEAMIATCVPGGSIVDPQVVADNIRHWFAAQPSTGGQGDAWDIAELVRTDLDRQSCPDAYMRIAMESVVKHLAARQPVGDHLAQDRKMVSQPVGEPVDAIERIARLLYLRSCNRHADGSPYTEWEAMDDRIKDYYRKDAQDYEALRNCAVWPAGRENYTAPPAQATDLGQFREAVVHWYADADNANTNPAWVREESTRLLALIDSKATGNA
ncbi:hypothetical protein I5W36_16570 [Stenotrophomonas maltophilia]|uniref:putative methylase n=1 Tax=Stenotrophomonas phage S1 TaxID=573591 RepID=UPI000185A074|nr:putative methylase [Stenotrophomonas phage S1]ACJ24757.1 gp32 [Stenotrophomonas phage S1]MBH1778232.1 hypothetical protein [Stenotrophomonas maltophilia]MCM2995094.1 hypothetical protein [Stenotrophomonas maltophilia]